MDLLDMLLGKDNKRGGGRGDLPGIFGLLSRWLVGCGCLLLAVVIGGLILVLAGIISLGEDAVTVVIVVITIIVAVASLIRTSLGY